MKLPAQTPDNDIDRAVGGVPVSVGDFVQQAISGKDLSRI
jgi:hypothetical protein